MNLLIYIGITFIIFILFTILSYNKITELKNNLKNSRSLVEVFLQKRFDLIPNLVEITKGYVKHEKELLEHITELRRSYTKTGNNDIIKDLNSSYMYLIGIIENYPELKSGELFLETQKSLVKIESELQAARRIYNLDVTTYNNKISIFPFNIFAKIIGFKEESLFQADADVRIEKPSK